MKREWLLATAMSACFGCAEAQTAAPPPVPAPAIAPAPSDPQTSAATSPPVAPPVAPVVGSLLPVPANTPIRIELADAVASNSRVRGDKFAIRLAAPIIIDGQLVAPKGAAGMGEVVYAEAGGMGGAPGKLVLAARYIDVAGVRVRLKAFNLSAGGESNFRELQVAAELLGPAVMLINGRDVLYPVGTRAGAKVAEEVSLPVLPPPDAAPTASPSPPPPSQSPPPVSGAQTPVTSAPVVSKEP